MEKSIFGTLSAINCNDKTEKKNGLTYLSWAWAWSEFVKAYPNATYTIKKNENGMPYFKDGSGAFCYTTVTVGELTHEMWLPVMDMRNKAIIDPNAFEINKTVMRCLTKNLAMFGLGIYIYAGEDLPEETEEQKTEKKAVRDAEYENACKELEECKTLNDYSAIWEKYKQFHSDAKFYELAKKTGQRVKEV